MERDIPDYYIPVSLVLFDLLRIICQTEETRKQQDEQWPLYETLQSLICKFSSDVDAFLVGSHTEGSTTPGLQSDVDVVIIDNRFVITNNTSPLDQGHIHCQFSTKDTPAGYVKLQCKERDVIQLGTRMRIDREHPHISHQDVDHIFSCKKAGIYALHKFEYFRALWRPGSYQNPLDLNFAFQVNLREIDLEHCLLRHRSNRKFLDVLQSKEASYDRVNVVPVGSPHSFDEGLEWRLSFSMTERRLVTAFNVVQMHCYILLKMVLKCLIEAYVGKVLTSYHLKCFMFHMIDSTEEHMWVPENIMFCLEMCLKKITSWVLDGFCPDYFVPTNNLFQEKVCGPARFRLAALLNQLLSERGRFLLRISCDQIGDRLAIVSVNKDISTPACRFNHFAFKSLTIHTYLHLLQTFLKHTRYDHQFPLFIRLLQEYSDGSPLQKQVVEVLIGKVLSNLDNLDIENYIRIITSGTNEEHEQNTALRYLQLGANIDHIAGSLKLATYYFMSRRIFEAVPLLESVLNKFNFPLSTASVHKQCIMSETLQYLLQWFPIKDVLTNCIAYSVIFKQNEIKCIPAVLIAEMYRSIVGPGSEEQFWYGWAVVDSKIYALFLLHQCYMERKFYEDAMRVLVDLIRTIDGDITLLHRDTAFNLLADCLRKMGMTLGAYRCLRHSLLINGNSDRAASRGHNAAIWHLASLFYINKQLRK